MDKGCVRWGEWWLRGGMNEKCQGGKQGSRLRMGPWAFGFIIPHQFLLWWRRRIVQMEALTLAEMPVLVGETEVPGGTRTSPGRTWKVCAERTWGSQSSIPGPCCCEAEVLSHWATLESRKGGKSRRKRLCEPEREFCENDWICEAQVIELSGTVGWNRDSVQCGVVPEP